MSTPALLDVVVRSRQMQGQAIAVLELADPAGSPLPPFTAGAHVDVHLPGGIVRQYSLCGDPRERQAYRLGVLRDPSSRGGSIAVHDALAQGASLRIGAPRNHFPLADDAPYTILVGGGIGITPMLSMAWALHAAGRPFELHYCARSRDQAAFVEEMAAAPWARRSSLHESGDSPVSPVDVPAIVRAAPRGAHLYVCGPTGFMDWVIAQGQAAGLGARQIHREYFSAPKVEPTGEETAFDVVAARSGKEVRVEPGQTILAALKSIGIKVSVSCEEGVCGTCACTVIEGEPEHRDAYLTDEEREANDQIMVCCSRSRSARIVLDI